MNKIKDLLPPETQINKDAESLSTGLVAEFHNNGHLKFLGIYQDKTFDNYWTLSLEENIQEGRVLFKNAYNGTAFSEIYKDGSWERFDNWSDNTVPEKIDYMEWIEKWIVNIIREYQS